METKEQILQRLHNMITDIKSRTAELLEHARANGDLHYYFDSARCKEGEIIKLENSLETIIKKYE